MGIIVHTPWNKDPIITQPGFPMESYVRVFFVAQVMIVMLFVAYHQDFLNV